MGTWDDLRSVIAQLNDENPGALMSYPDPSQHADVQAPFAIGLAPWAANIARDLHDRFGSDVQLQVGALAYPHPRSSAYRLAA